MKKPHNQLYSKLPEVYRYEDRKDKHLLKMLDVLETGFKHLDDKITEYTRLFDIDSTPEELLNLMANMLGYELPYDMGVVEKRKIVKALPILLKMKGTPICFEYLGREVFGWDTRVIKNTLFETNTGTSLLNNDVMLRKNLVSIELLANAEKKFLSNKVVNYKKFIEFFRPVNLLIQVILVYLYEEIYSKDNIVESLSLDEIVNFIIDGYFKDIKISSFDDIDMLKEYEKYNTFNSKDYDNILFTNSLSKTLNNNVLMDFALFNKDYMDIIDKDRFNKVMYEPKYLSEIVIKDIYNSNDFLNNGFITNQSMINALEQYRFKVKAKDRYREIVKDSKIDRYDSNKIKDGLSELITNSRYRGLGNYILPSSIDDFITLSEEDKMSKIIIDTHKSVLEVDDSITHFNLNQGMLNNQGLSQTEKYDISIIKDKSMASKVESMYNDIREVKQFRGMSLLNDSRFEICDNFTMKSLYSYDTIIEGDTRRVQYV